MAVVTPMDAEHNKTSWHQRMGAFGDLPTRFLRSSLRVAPWFIEPVLLSFWSFIFFALASSQRRAVIANLSALFPQWSRIRTTFGAFRVFRNFAATYVDALRCETQSGDVDWVIDGLDSFRQLAEADTGCIVLTAHMGNYDLAAPVFSDRFQRTIHAVRAPERNPEMQAIRETERRAMESRFPMFQTHYNRDGDMLGVKLAQLLAKNDVVAIQADRTIGDSSSMTVTLEDDLTLNLPKGPLYLAQITNARCFPLVVTRDGWRRYRVTVWPELTLPPRKRGAAVDQASIVWAHAILDMIRPHWNQWFVFEPILQRNQGGTP